MKIRKDFKLREICGEYVVTAEGMQAVDFTKLISLNETAAFLWKTAEKQGEFTVASLAQALCDEYDVVMAQAEKDCEAIIAQWQKEEVCTMVFPPDVCSPWTFAVAHHRRSPAGSIRFVARLAVSPVHRCGDLAWQCAARNHRAFFCHRPADSPSPAGILSFRHH